MQVNRLSVDELEYLVLSRGMPKGTVEEMRRLWRLSVKREKKGLSFVDVDYPFTFSEDVKSIAHKISEIQTILNPVTGEMPPTLYNKCITKAEWAYYRLEQSQPSEGAEEQKKKSLSGDILFLMSQIEARIAGGSQAESEDEFGEPLGIPGRTSTPPTPRPDISSLRVSKWGLKFAGKGGESLNEFLTRVDEIRIARGVSKAELLRSALDLFEDKALIWYRANKSSCVSWDALVSELKAAFLPANYDDRLVEEIRLRTQGKDESIDVYIAVMHGLFSRLATPYSEEQRLKILLRNVSPFYQTQLSLVTVSTTNELIRYGRALEATKISVEGFAPPPSRKSNLLEPDLAYVGSSRVNEIAEVQGRSSRGVVKCWNCKRQGHLANRCREQKKCFGCGEVGVFKRDCQRCKPAENARQTH